jgi:hypothetical protein
MISELATASWPPLAAVVCIVAVIGIYETLRELFNV